MWEFHSLFSEFNFGPIDTRGREVQPGEEGWDPVEPVATGKAVTT
jgi:hypothetical protein